MERSSFFNSVNGDRKYKADSFANYFSSFIGNGVFPNPSTNLQVIVNEAMKVSLRKGKAWINGYMYENTDSLSLDVEVADSVLGRIDRVVLRKDVKERKIFAYIKKGEFSSSPKPPTLQRDMDAYELGLANININKGITTIKQGSIVDLRLNSELCGIAHGLIDQVDTTTLFEQYETWYKYQQDRFDEDLTSWTNLKKDEINNIEKSFKLEFREWFETIRDILDEDVAGNIINMVERLPKVLSSPDEPTNIRPGDMWLREVD